MLQLDPIQQRAVDAITSEPFALITGGPGTGKTTCLRTAVDELESARRSVILCAPTGKAARRMTESTGRPASTIHRMLGYRPGRGFMYDRVNPISADVVIVDEASMLDVELAAALFRALGSARLALVGDADQLPPVGPGQLFADLVRAGESNDRSFDLVVVRLRTPHRSGAGSWVGTNAPRALAGEALPLDPAPDFRHVNVRSAAGVLDAVRGAYADVTRAHGEPQLLIPMRDGPCGTAEANIMLQRLCNDRPAPRTDADRAQCVERDRHWIMLDDRVIQTRNNYELDVFNGDVGQVIEADAKTLAVQYMEPGPGGALVARTVVYDRARGDDQALELAYALTVHKSQGSEWPWVMVVVHSSHTIMLTRRLFYTAITRAKSGVVLVGDDAGLERVRSVGHAAERNSTLIDRIAGAIDPVIEPPPRGGAVT